MPKSSTLKQSTIWGSLRAGSAEELSALKFGYPTLLQLPDGDVLAAFWCFEEWTTIIRWIRLRVG